MAIYGQFSGGSISSSIIPDTDNAYDLGSASFRFRTLYLGTSATINTGAVAPVTSLTVGDTSTSSPRGVMSWQSNTGTDGARLHLRKSRGTFAAPTVVVTGDTLGKIVATGYDGSNFLEMGSISVNAEGTIASTRIPTNIVFSTATNAAPSVLTDRWKIDSSGNFLAVADNTYNIGASGGTRPANIYGINIFSGGYLGFIGSTVMKAPSNGVLSIRDAGEAAAAGLLSGRVVTAKTSDYPVVALDSNRFFTNTGASATVIFTLPTPVAGMTYEFYRDANFTVQLTAPASTTVRVGASVTTAAGNVTLDAVGSRIRIVAISATQYVGDLTGTATFN
jgi:hypothetical protein